MSPPKLPTVEHVYQNYHIDSTRWEHFVPRDDDIIIATSYKAGTTWMQNIVQHMIFLDLEQRPVHEISPWLDNCTPDLQEILERIGAQQHRRFLKTHLPLDGLLYFPRVKYIVVARDPRDVFMSLWNHYHNFTPDLIEKLNNPATLMGNPLPPCPADIHDFWRDWISKGWFAWENEGYPFWSNMRHVQTWWDYHHLPNILMVHFNDLLQDTSGQIRRIADYLDIEIPIYLLPEIVKAVSFEVMKNDAEKLVPGTNFSFKGGPQTFINQGTNGRWRDVLTEEELTMYAATLKRETSVDCALWLEHGWLGA